MRYLPIFLLLMSAWGCQRGDVMPDPVPSEQTIQNIGPSGGEIVLNAFTLRIPSGSFQASHDITVTETNTETTAFSEILSKSYFIEGVPASYTSALEIGLRSETDFPEDSRFVLQEVGFVSSLDTTTVKSRVLSPQIDGSEMWAMLGTPDDGLAKDGSASELREDAKLEFSIFGISSYATYTTSDGKFEIDFPAEHLDKIYTLGAYLSEAYEKIESIGFSFDNRTNWPMEISVINLKPSVFGYASASIWGDNYGSIEINLLNINKPKELKTTVGHELLHIAQSLYDPRNAFSKAKFASNHLWLDEATSVWFERIISGDPNYVSPVFETAAQVPLLGAHVATSPSYRSDYGYGQAALVQYIENTFGRNKIVSFYQGIQNGKSAFDAINSSLPKSISSFWHDYLDDLLSFSIYKSDGFGPSWVIGNAKLTIDMPADPVSINGTRFGSSTGPLSAHILFLKDNNTYNEQIQLKLKIEETTTEQQIHAFSFNSQEVEHLGTDKDSVFLSNYNEIIESNSRVFVLISDEAFIRSSDNFRPYQFNPVVYKTIPLGFLNFDIDLRGLYKVTKPDTTYELQNPISLSNHFYYVNNSGPISYTQSGNSVNYAFSYQYFDAVITVNCSFLFDNLELPQTIEYFEIDQQFVSSGSSGEQRRQTFVSGQDIRIAKPDDGLYTYLAEGDVSGHLTQVSTTFTQTNSEGTVTRMDELISHDASDGNLRLWFRE